MSIQLTHLEKVSCLLFHRSSFGHSVTGMLWGSMLRQTAHGVVCLCGISVMGMKGPPLLVSGGCGIEQQGCGAFCGGIVLLVLCKGPH